MNEDDMIRNIAEINVSVHEMRLRLDMRFDYIERDINMYMDKVDEIDKWKSGITGAQRVGVYAFGIFLIVYGLLRIS